MLARLALHDSLLDVMIRLRAYHVITLTAIIVSLQIVINYFWSTKQKTCEIYPNFEDDYKHIPNAYIMFIIILSARENVQKRIAIRETWLLPLQKIKNVKYRFVIGRGNEGIYLDEQLDQENGVYGDILILSEVEDSYKMLTGKVVESFKWVNKNIRTDFVLKCDDDSFVQLSKLLEVIGSEDIPKARFYWGYFRGRSSVKRTGKWAEKEWNLCDKYLPFAFGGGYILSSDLVRYLALNSDFLRRFRNEDVTIGAWLSVLDVTKRHDTRFNTEAESRGCSNDYLVSHKETPENMHAKFQSIVETGRMCSKEFNSYPGYVYNWNVLPSYCCHRMEGIE